MYTVKQGVKDRKRDINERENKKGEKLEEKGDDRQKYI